MNPSATPVQSKPRSTARDPLSVELSQRGDGTVAALSRNGTDIYTVRKVAGGWQCQCPGFASRSSCCHVLAVASAATCFWCGHYGAAVATYRNGFDAGRPISLCGTCLPAERVLREVA